MWYLVCYNDETMDLSILAGPVTRENVESELNKAVKTKLCQSGKTEVEAVEMMKEAKEGLSEECEIYDYGAVIRYPEGDESRIQAVPYDFQQISVNTPNGEILSKVMPDDEYIGIATLIQRPGEPGVIVEYDPERDKIVSRIYSAEDPEGDPRVIEF